jgi:hypothetical protein
MKNKMWFWLFMFLYFAFLPLLVELIDKEFGAESTDCVNCVHGTSSGNGICKDCNGNHFEDKGDVE